MNVKPGALKLAMGLGFAGALAYVFGRKTEVVVDIGEAVITPSFVFPVDGSVSFSDTFGAPRDGGRAHQGADIFADEGTPVRAVVDGSVSFGSNTLGGLTATVIGADNTSYYYAHLSAQEGEPRGVHAGDLIGYVGHTGNAAHTLPHLHFEVHPNRGVAVNPYKLLKNADVNHTASA